jgi:hypothetical protein
LECELRIKKHLLCHFERFLASRSFASPAPKSAAVAVDSEPACRYEKAQKETNDRANYNYGQVAVVEERL